MELLLFVLLIYVFFMNRVSKIIGGTLRSCLLQYPNNNIIRPTKGFVREAIFNVLNFQMNNESLQVVLDVFSGSGALGFEAISRGVNEGIFFERLPQVFKILKANATNLNVLNKSKLILKDIFYQKTWPFKKANIVFLDPPYGKNLVDKSLKHLHVLQAIEHNAFVICEQGKREKLIYPNFYQKISYKVYGNTSLFFCVICININYF